MRKLAALLLTLPLINCIMLQPPPPQDPAPSSSSETTSAGLENGRSPTPASTNRAMGSPPSAGRVAAPNEKTSAPAHVPTTVEIHSDCSKTIAVFYGDKPKFGSGTKSSLSSNSTSSASRKADGSLTVWIIDESENGIASAHVDANTKRVEIDRSCKNISAR